MVKFIVSWLCFHVGDLISKVMLINFMFWLYPVYNQLMKWSYDLDVDQRIWTKVDQNEVE